jgi:hypothetical protein
VLHPGSGGRLALLWLSDFNSFVNHCSTSARAPCSEAQ